MTNSSFLNFDLKAWIVVNFIDNQPFDLKLLTLQYTKLGYGNRCNNSPITSTILVPLGTIIQN